MKTVTINLFEFDELSEEAKRIAVRHFQEDDTLDESVHSDSMQSLNAFNELFKIQLINWHPNGLYKPGYRLLEDDQILDLSGRRLQKYLWNNYGEIYKGKFYYRFGRSRHSRILIHGAGSCPFTGCVYDDVVLNPVYDFINARNPEGNFRQLIDACLNLLSATVESETEYIYSKEGIEELIGNGEYWFTEIGRLYDL